MKYFKRRIQQLPKQVQAFAAGLLAEMNSSATPAGKVESGSSVRRARIPPVKVKKVLQSDEDIGKMNNAVPIVFASILEHFIEVMLLKAEQVASRYCLKTLNSLHIKLAAERDPSLSFLLPIFDNVLPCEQQRRLTMESSLRSGSPKGTSRKRRRASSFVDDDDDTID